MPIYEYQCQECGRVEEVMQRMSDAPLSRHAEIGGSCEGGLKKLISATNVGRTVGAFGGMPMDTSAPSCGTCGMAPGSCSSN